jgi:hypothetical protein
MTFSINGWCARTGMLGVAITTSSIAVGARCPYARAGTGAVATQNVTDSSYGPRILDLLAANNGAEGALAKALSDQAFTEYRQLTVIDRVHSGKSSLPCGGGGCVGMFQLLKWAKWGRPAAARRQVGAGAVSTSPSIFFAHAVAELPREMVRPGAILLGSAA